MFYFPATAAMLLRQDSWLCDYAIANALRNYGRRREQWWVLSRRPDYRSYRFVPVSGGWLVFLETSFR